MNSREGIWEEPFMFEVRSFVAKMVKRERMAAEQRVTLPIVKTLADRPVHIKPRPAKNRPAPPQHHAASNM
ncbi:hypothetical protein FJW08_25860 [Mesorhizobium sp. B3-2-1]|uniref:hypothetical protein n=2 Tax=Mesorhizobium TaxID=68287 RepID=UPI001128EE2E|nr:hypothetical protein [Mesorhizobium sp. B3-2-1]TPI27051.1 hypothetical protein FJW08_25860 [Mesorhizobium sp. B3-2-1]